MDAFLKIYLPVFLVTFIAWVFVVPSLKVYKQTRINPFRFATKHNPTHDYVGNSMKVFILLLLITIGVYSISDTAYQYFAPFRYLEIFPLKIAGLIFVHISLIGIKVAQLQMRLSWRIGIDYENRTKLVTSGLFSMSRNPIYVFLLIGLVGMFLILPNAITFAILFASFLVLHITMRLEEDFLQKQHGEAYINYQKSVRRLI